MVFQINSEFIEMLGEYANMTILDLLKKELKPLDNTYKLNFENEFEALKQKLDRDEKIGIKKIDRLNKEIQEFNDILEDEVNAKFLMVSRSTFLEIIADQVKNLWGEYR